MRILVYMKDGRTVFYFERRSDLGRAMKGPADNEEPSVVAAKGTWNPHTGLYDWQRNFRVRFIAANSISWVEEGRPADAEEPSA